MRHVLGLLGATLGPHLGSYLVGEVGPGLVVYAHVDVLAHDELLDALVLFEQLEELFVEDAARVRQVHGLLFLLRDDAAPDADADVVRVVERELFVPQRVALRVYAELKEVADFFVEQLYASEEALDLGLCETLPLLVVLFPLGEDLDLEEVLVGLEEGELFEEALPADARRALVAGEFVRDHGRLFELGQHHVARRVTHVVGRVHRREGRRDDWHHRLRVQLVNHIRWNRELHDLGVVRDFAKRDGVVGAPFVVAVVLEEAREQLVRGHLGVVLTDLGHEDGPGNSS